MTEASIKKAFAKKIKAYGFEYFRMDTDGWPDWLVMGPCGVVGFIEFKSKAGRLRDSQKVRLNWLNENGFDAFVINSASDDVVTQFVEIMKKKMEEKHGN